MASRPGSWSTRWWKAVTASIGIWVGGMLMVALGDPSDQVGAFLGPFWMGVMAAILGGDA